jgi:hypothetical protein
MRPARGKLMLTDSRLEFRAHEFDDALGGTGWAAELGQIRSVGKQNRGSEIEEASGARTYHLASEQADVDAFDVMLDDIDPDWHEQLTRTGP